MLINKNTFKEKSFFDKVFTSFKTLNHGKSFYVYIALYLCFIIAFLALSSFIKNKYTVDVPKYEQKLNIYSDDEVKNILPALAQNRTELILSKLVFAGLLKNSDNNTYTNDLAESVSYSEDGLKVDVKIRDDANFSNGKTVTSDDVIYSYSLIQDYDIDNRERAKYEGLVFSKIDDKNFTINLKKSYSEIQKLLTLGIVSKSELSKYHSKELFNVMFTEEFLKRYFSSSGQYKLNNIEVDKNKILNISLKNNNNYNNLAYYQNVNMFLGSIAAGKVPTYFKDNKIDISLTDLKGLDENKYSNTPYLSSRIKTIFFNPNKNQTLAKKENRRFIYEAADRYYISNNILGGIGSSTYDIMAISQNDLSTSTISLASTTLSSTTPITITYLSDSDTDQKIFNYLKSVLESKGITLLGKGVSSYEMQSVIKNRDYEMLLSAIYIEDYSSLYSFFHSSQKNAPGLNLTNYVSKDFDQNIETIRRSTSSEDLNNALSKLRQEFYVEYPFMPLYTRKYFIIVNKDINIKINEYVSNDGELLNNLGKAYKNTEPTYKFLIPFTPYIIKINKLIN